MPLQDKVSFNQTIGAVFTLLVSVAFAWPLPPTQDLRGVVVSAKGLPIAAALCTLNGVGLPAEGIGVTTNDVNDWRDEALLLNLASFGTDEQRMFTQAGIVGLRQLLALDRDTLGAQLDRAARTLGMAPPSEITVDGWFAQARTLEEE